MGSLLRNLRFGGDDKILDPFQTSHRVAHALGIALDALRTARIIIDGPAGIRVALVGQYPVLRTAMESAALAMWLLQPDERANRLARSIAASWDDVLHDVRLVTASTEEDVSDTKAQRSDKNKIRREHVQQVRATKKRIREVAHSAGISDDDYNRGLPGFGPIIRESAEAVGVSGSHALGAWSAISGLTHPSQARTLMLSDMAISSTNGSVHTARLTARISMVAFAMDAAMLSFSGALDLLARRSDDASVAWTPASINLKLIPPRFRTVSNQSSCSEN